MAGITKVGTTIFFEDDTNVDAGGDGSYSFADISAKFPADFVDLGTTPKTYRAVGVSLTNGDGGTAVTTLKDSSCTVVFDAGRTYSVSATGRANRFTEFGVKVSGTKSSGRSGVRLVCGASTNIQGNLKFYGSIIETTGAGTLTVAPGQTGLSTEVINCLLSTAGAAITFGTGTAAVDTAYNVDFIGGSAVAAAITTFSCANAERITIGINPSTTRHIQTTVAPQIRDCVLIGTTANASVRNVGAQTWAIVAPTWDQNNVIADSTGAGNIQEWWPYNIAATDQNATPIPGLPFTLADRTGATVISTTTNATGELSYGSGVTANCVNVVTYTTGGGIDYRGPFTARLNQGGSANSSYPSKTVLFDWDSTATWLGSNKQYGDMYDIFQLIPPGGSPTGWVELSM